MSEKVHDEKFTTDKDGNRVRRGLTFEETTSYEDHLRRRLLPEAERKPPDPEELESFLELDQKHYAACMITLEAERVIRVEKPPIN